MYFGDRNGLECTIKVGSMYIANLERPANTVP